MSLNLIFGGLLALGALYVGKQAYTYSTPPVQPITPWGEQVGKTKHIQSLTKDASLATERIRRRAIASSRKVIRDTNLQKGSTSGALETYILHNLS